MDRRIDSLIIHCSNSPNGQWVTVEDIDAWHRQRDPRLARAARFRARQNQLLAHIGYHFVFYTNGAVVTGRHLDEPGVHARGHNRHSLGLCLIGRDRFTLAQWDSLRACICALVKRYAAAAAGVELAILGHREVEAQKTCPHFDVSLWLKNQMAPEKDWVLA